jgi:hypothetical protein
MSKDKTKVGEFGFIVNGFMLTRFSRLEGKIRTIVESVGLPEKQEKALSQLLVNETWELWESPDYSYNYIGNHQDNATLQICSCVENEGCSDCPKKAEK